MLSRLRFLWVDKYFELVGKNRDQETKKTYLCEVIKQDESEVGSDMLLVSEVSFRFNIYVNVNFKPDTCRKCLLDYTQI